MQPAVGYGRNKYENEMSFVFRVYLCCSRNEFWCVWVVPIHRAVRRLTEINNRTILYFLVLLKGLNMSAVSNIDANFILAGNVTKAY